MPRLPLAAAVAAAVLGACSIGGSPAPHPRPSPTPPPTPLLVLRPPAQAVLPAVSGLSPASARDHLSAAEYAASAPDQVVSLGAVQSWGWADASQRTWSGAGAGVDDLVVATDRSEGAKRAFAFWAGQAAAAPFQAADCPGAIAGLDQCVVGVAGKRTVVVGRLDAEVFRLDVTNADAVTLAAAQAQRLRAT